MTDDTNNNSMQIDGGAGAPAAADNQQLVAKKQRNNDGSAQPTVVFSMDSDVDDIIGDLVKEELQLLLTRMLKTQPTAEDSVKKESLRIITSRSKQSAAPMSKQLQVMQRLLQQHSSVAMAMQAGGAGAGGGDLDATQAYGLMSQFGAGGDLPLFSGAAGGAGASGAGGRGGGDFVAAFMGDPVAMTRRRVREAFKKDTLSAIKKRTRFGEETKHTYRVDSGVIRMELERAKDLIFNKNEQRQGLQLMDAITHEFVTMGNDIGIANITFYNENLLQIAADWAEIFLFEELDLEQVEREEWAAKLFDIDTSPNEEEGTFSVARYAARLGWNNTHLKNVLKGESIGKFKEPKELSLARLAFLERKQRYEEGVNLAKAVDQDFHAAKFLLKINRLLEAQESAKLLEDPEQVFSLAQIARPLDVSASFNLALRSVAIVKDWDAKTAERAQWLADLVISQKLIDTLVEQLQATVRNKPIQFEFAKILKEKEQYQGALQICKYAVKPAAVDVRVIQAQQDALGKLRQQTVDVIQQGIAAVQAQLQAQQQAAQQGDAAAAAAAAQAQQLPEVEPPVPYNLAVWTWQLVHEMLMLELISEDDMLKVVNYLLEVVADVDQLRGLMSEMAGKLEFEQVILVGNRALDRIKEQGQRERQLQVELIKNILETQYAQASAAESPQAMAQLQQINALNQTIQFADDPLKDETAFQTLLKMIRERKAVDVVLLDPRQLLQQQTQTVGSVPSILQQGRKVIAVNYNSKWDHHKLAIAQAITDAALESNNPVYQQLPAQPMVAVALGAAQQQQAGLQPVKQKRPPRPLPRSRLEQTVETVLANLDHAVNLSQYQKRLHQKTEYSLAIRVGQRVHDLLKALSVQKKKRDEEAAELSKLRLEENDAVLNKRQLKLEKRLRLRELEYQQRVYQLDSNLTTYGADNLDQIHSDVAQTSFTAGADSRLALDAEKQISKETIEAEVVTRSMSYFRSPAQFERLANLAHSRFEYDICVNICRRGHALVEQLQQRKLEREKILVPMGMLRDEQATLLAKKQQLSPQKAQQLVQLEKSLEALPPVESFDPNQAEQYEQLHCNLSTIMANAALSSAVQQITNTQFGIFNLAQQQQQQRLQQIIVQFSDEQIRSIVVEAFGYFKMPQLLIQLAQTVDRYRQQARLAVELVIELGSKAQDSIAVQAEERKAREMPRLKFNLLKQQEQELAQQGKFLKPEQVKELADQDLEQRLAQATLPRYSLQNNLAKFDAEIKQITQIMTDCLLQKRNETELELQELQASRLARTGPDAMQMDEEDEEAAAERAKKDEEEKLKIQELEQYMQQLSGKIDAVVRRALQFVQDPHERLRIAKSLIRYKEFNLPIVVGKAIQERIPVLIEEKRKKDQLDGELRELEAEEAELAEKRAALGKKQKLDGDKQARIEELRLIRAYNSIFPSYMNNSEDQLTQLHVDNAEMMIGAIVAKRNAESVRLAQEHPDMAEADRKQQLSKYDQEIEQITEHCIQYVQNPEHLIRLLAYLQGNDAPFSLLLKLGKYALERTRTCIDKRLEYTRSEQMVAILNQESENLKLLRKTLSDDLQKTHDDQEKKMADMALPTYILNSSLAVMHGWRYNAFKKLMSVVLQDKRAFEERIASDFSLTTELIESEKARIAGMLRQVVDLLVQDSIGIESPSNLLEFVTDLNDKREYKIAIEIAGRLFAILLALRQAEAARRLPEQNHALLLAEESSLLQQRKQLSDDKQQQLRELKLQHAMFEQQPPFVKSEEAEYDRVAYHTALAQIESVLGMRQLIDDKMEDIGDSQMDSHHGQLEREKAEVSELLGQVLDKSVANVLVIENLIKLTNKMSERLEYGLVLRLGETVVKRIDVLRKQVIEIEQLETEKAEVEKKARLGDAQAQAKLVDIDGKLNQLPLKYKNTKLIDKLMLSTAKMMSNAAKVEERNDVLLEMAIVLFKLQPSVLSFGEVKVLCDEQEWERKVRVDLLNHVLLKVKEMFEKKDTSQFGSADQDVDMEDDEDLYYSDDERDSRRGGGGARGKKKTAARGKKASTSASESSGSNPIKDMIELLLNEGYWQHVVQIFPKPPNGSVDLLERLWVELQRNSPAAIKNIVPLAEEYIVNDFMQFEFEKVKSLQDLVEQHDVKVAIGIYERCAEKMTLNINQKQYSEFVDWMAQIKERLLKHGQDDKWLDFYDSVYTKNKGKKKLANMLEVANLK